MKTLFTLFSVAFILWVLFGPAFNDSKDDKKKKSDNAGGGMLLGLLFAPFVLAGWLLFGFGQMLLLLLQAIAALWENAMPFFRRLFEMLGKLLEWIWKAVKWLLKQIDPLLRGLFKTIGYALRTVLNALRSVLHAFASFIRSLLSFIGDLVRDFPGVLRTFGKILKGIARALRFVRDVLGRLLTILWLPFAGIIAFVDLGRTDGEEGGRERTRRAAKGHARRAHNIEREPDGPDAAELLTALVPAPIVVAAKRTKKEGARRLAAANPLKKGLTRRRRKDDPHVMARLQQIGWETRRKMGKA